MPSRKEVSPPSSGRDSALMGAVLHLAFADISIGKYCSMNFIVYYWLDSLEPRE